MRRAHPEGAPFGCTLEKGYDTIRRKAFWWYVKNFLKMILMCFSEKRVTLIDLRYVFQKTECQFGSILYSASSFSPVYSWFLASNPKTSRTNLRDVSASDLLCWCLDTSAYFLASSPPFAGCHSLTCLPAPQNWREACEFRASHFGLPSEWNSSKPL